MNPLAIDLFCGLFQAQLCGRGYSFVQHLVARRAENPDHMPLAIRHQAPAPFAFVARTVSHFDNALLPARFARARKVGVFSSESSGYYVLVWSARVVDLLNLWILSVKRAALNLRSLGGAAVRTVALVAVRRRDVKVLSADATIATSFRYIGLFAPAQSSLARLASVRAVALIGAFRLKCRAAHCAE